MVFMNVNFSMSRTILIENFFIRVTLTLILYQIHGIIFNEINI